MKKTYKIYRFRTRKRLPEKYNGWYMLKIGQNNISFLARYQGGRFIEYIPMGIRSLKLQILYNMSKQNTQKFLIFDELPF